MVWNPAAERALSNSEEAKKGIFDGLEESAGQQTEVVKKL
jgi:hypothetical protein